MGACICKRLPLLHPMVLLLLSSNLSVLVANCSQHHQEKSEEASCDSQEVCPTNIGSNQIEQHANYYTRDKNTGDDQLEQSEADGCHFRAAVLEYNRVDLEKCDQTADLNLKHLDEATKLAAHNGSHLIVFPEDAIVWGPIKYLLPCLEEIPDPNNITEVSGLTRLKDGGNPCIQPELFSSFKILTKLSCMARQYNIYIVANYGTKEPCDQKQDKFCHQGGFKPLNTNVILEPTGKFIGRYRKYNPFIEVFEKAPRLEHVYFDTPFGRFGVFTCFDMIFKHPAVDLVEQYHIDTAIFPTWWYDELPILTALQFQDAWSTRHKVNLLASNILKPSLGSTGSSIFSGDESVYVGATNKKPRLLIANLQKRREDAKTKEGTKQDQCSASHDFSPVVMDLPSPMVNETYEHKNYAMYFDTDDVFFPIRPESHQLNLCARSFCCKMNSTVKYDLTEQDPDLSKNPRWVVLVRNSRRSGRFEWAEQVCALATLDHPLEDARKPMNFSQNPLPVPFTTLSLEANFNTDYVYPYAAHNVSQLLERKARQFGCQPSEGRNRCRLTLKRDGKHLNTEGTYLYSFGMYGRVYEADK